MTRFRFLSIAIARRTARRRTWPALLVVALALAAPAGAAKKQGEGGWRLAGESSPYLQMHRDNPVEWYPWGEEALARAQAENKPLFISIGYFTCHWCHVMERESFRDPAIARLLKEGYISIKIDREQRPDLDAAYMTFVVATNGYGGWPMTVLATPDGTPFFGGTYFPPQDRDHAPGLAPLLRKARALWDKDRRKLIDTARAAVAQIIRNRDAATPLARLTPEPVELARRQFAARFDHYDGGFGFAPKFPQPAELLFLLQDEAKQSADMALFTLDRMAAGAIHDHLEGGFHRYTTDAAWRVPHFEKMLYDQGLIARAYLGAYRRSGDRKYAEVAKGILDFALAGMRDARGGFYSALSADSAVSKTRPQHMEEGAYYVWEWKQLEKAVPDAGLRQWAVARYGLAPEGNVADGSSAELAGKNVLYLAKTEAELAKQFGVTPPRARERLEEVNRHLLGARRARPAVPRDEKIVTAWNGYMITALAEAGQLLESPAYRRAAGETARFVLDKLYDDVRNVLYRDWHQGRRGVAGFAEDYAAMAEALLALHGLDGDKAWLATARKLTDAQIELFWDGAGGGFYGAGKDAGLWLRDKPAADHVTPSASAMAVGNLLKLARLTGERGYADKAGRTAAWMGGVLRETPEAMPYTLMHWPLLMAQASRPDPAKSR